MRAAGFVAVTVDYEDLRFEQNLAEWLAMVRRRDINSQLMTISDAAYAAGIARLERETGDPSLPQSRDDHWAW